MAELLIGCGTDRSKKLVWKGRAEWSALTTLDMNPAAAPDVVFDLNDPVLPFGDDAFDEIHAYDVLEHVGRQGDWRFFLDQFADFWRVLKPGGVVLGISPHPSGPWAWGDPGHTRVISPESFVFLHQPNYGRPPMTDYRPWYRADFDLVHSEIYDNLQHGFVLQAVKPSRVHGQG